MPIFDMRCPSCEKIKKDVFVHSYKNEIECKQCHVNMKKLVPSRINLDILPNGGVFLKHVSAEGQHFNSKKEMRQYEKDHNVQLSYLGH